MDASGVGGADDDVVNALIVERDLWRRRANESEERWESFLTLEAERAELREQAAEMLTETHQSLIAERDSWRRRALNAEALVCADADNRVDLKRLEAIGAERARSPRATSVPRKNGHDPTEGDQELETPARRDRYRGSWLD